MIDPKIEKISMPKVKFEVASIKEDTNTIFHFCYNKSGGGWDWSKYVYNQHPKLKEMVEGVKDKDEFYNKCREYVEGYLKEHHEDIEKARENFQKLWEEVEEKFYDNILKDFDIEFPEEIKEIKATVSINPICPRNIDKWSFNVNYKQAGDRMKQTAVHEIIHFLYFKKWMAVFPDHDKKTFNNPHSQWKLSEMLVNPIINNNETIQEIINNQKGEGYSEFKNIKINNKTLNEFFGEIYKEHVEGKISFGDFLKRSWEEYQRHKDIIENYKK